MKKILQVSNVVALISTIIINYLSNTGIFNNTTIAQVSDNYKSLFTPAGYTFAIWGFIYALLISFVFYQSRSLFVKVRDDNFVLKTGWWFVLSCVFNSCWVLAWLFGYTALSCILIFLLLVSLVKILINNRIALYDPRFSTIAFLWWPFVVYSGWVTVASIANVSSYLVKINWDGFNISESVWTVLMVLVSVIINIIVIWKRNMREFAVVGIWALFGIASANKDLNNVIVTSCYVGIIILAINVIIHGYKNRETNPFTKLKEQIN